MARNYWRYPKVRALLASGNEPAWLKTHPRRKYVIQAIMATPPWMTNAELRAVYERRLPGEVVDHVVPLVHPRVCGLHVPWNLQCVTRAVNAAKSNHWCPEQMALFA